MLPVLFSLGPFSFKTLNLFLVVAFISAAFLFWRKSREEHYEETQVFDGFLLSTVFGFVMGRLGFILLNFDHFQLNILKWLDVVNHPGMTILIGLIAAGIHLFRFSAKHKWDVFEILDFWVMGLSCGLGIMWLGLFLDGSGFGYPTSLPWGMVFPGVFEKHHPTQLYFALFFLTLFWYLSWVEYRYRTFSWYRAGKNTAQTGFLTSMFIFFTGLLSLVVAFVRPAQLTFQGINFDMILFLGMMMLGVGLMFSRSGRNLPFSSRKSGFRR
jgi:phosphatidylglycerol:prolipoprotein diacylglycerol transferase